MKPLTAEEIAELRRLEHEADSSRAAATEFERAAWDMVPRLLDEVERWRNPESVKMWRDENAATLERARALLKRIEWDGEDQMGAYACPECAARPPGPLTNNGGKHWDTCELAALIGETT